MRFEGQPEATRIVIVEDHPAIGEGLAALLNGDGVSVVGTAATAEAAETVIREQRPDVVLCDVMLGGRDAGFDLLAKLGKISRFLMMSAFDYPAHHARAIRAGASGYVSKMVDANALVHAIQLVAAGERGFDASVLESARRAPRFPTNREREMLVELAHGATNEEIAAALRISVKTVEGMLRRLFERYGVTNRTELVRLANAQGWLTSSPG